MSAEVLREAAALMRERAEAARSGEWYTDGPDVLAAWARPRPITTCDGSPVHEGNLANAAHIASWHPAVALAVADWLDAEAETHRADLVGPFPSACCRMGQALAVARAYLGADQ